jgi:hypothetical protein
MTQMLDLGEIVASKMINGFCEAGLGLRMRIAAFP